MRIFCYAVYLLFLFALLTNYYFTRVISFGNQLTWMHSTSSLPTIFHDGILLAVVVVPRCFPVIARALGQCSLVTLETYIFSLTCEICLSSSWYTWVGLPWILQGVMPPNLTQKTFLQDNTTGVSFSSQNLEQSKNDRNSRKALVLRAVVTDSELPFMNVDTHFVDNS